MWSYRVINPNCMNWPALTWHFKNSDYVLMHIYFGIPLASVIIPVGSANILELWPFQLCVKLFILNFTTERQVISSEWNLIVLLINQCTWNFHQQLQSFCSENVLWNFWFRTLSCVEYWLEVKECLVPDQQVVICIPFLLCVAYIYST